jgi:hypothetical protein
VKRMTRTEKACVEYKECSMTSKQLESLAVYRKHKNCRCVHCQEARRVLSEYDRQPRVCGDQGSQNICLPDAP